MEQSFGKEEKEKEPCPYCEGKRTVFAEVYCDTCKGSGKISKNGTGTKCPMCREGVRHEEVICGHCDGTGKKKD